MESAHGRRLEHEQIRWEQRVLKELYREYDFTLSQHRVAMLPAVIELFESDTCWGRWLPESRTIQISRTVVSEQSWFQVLGILRHEMAHQLVDESMRGLVEGRPHGDEFQSACKRLGVPLPFSKASCEMPLESLDWRGQKADQRSERMLEKVRKLLALAGSSNEHEALLAMNRVREIYAKYNLDRYEAESSLDYVHLVLGEGRKRIEVHQKQVVSILVAHFFVKAIYGKLFDTEDGKDSSVVELVGRRENVLMAEYVYHFLLQQCEYHLKAKEKQAGRSLGRIGRKSFRLGLLKGFEEKLSKPNPRDSRSIDSPLQDKSVACNSETLLTKAMTVFASDKDLEEYMSYVYPTSKLRHSLGCRLDRQFFGEGKVVGTTITLNRPVSHSPVVSGKFLRS